MERAGRWAVCAVGALLAVNLCIVMVCAPVLDYDSKTNLVQLDPVFLLVAVGFGILVCAVVRAVVSSRVWRTCSSPKGFFACVGLVMVALVASQVVMFQGAFFRTGWDLIYIADLDSAASYLNYFQTYPNQNLLRGIFELVAAPLRADGSYTLMGCYLRVAILACACVDISIVAITAAARKVAGPAVGFATLALSVVMCGLSPWVMVPYTDALGMLCPSLAFASYACVRDGRVKAALVGALGIFGYFVKPTAIFVLVAIALVELTRGHMADRLRQAGASRVAMGVTAFLVASAMGYAGAQALSSKTLELDPQKAFSATHYLMMGANEADGGGFSGTDVRLSWSYPTSSERSAAELAEWKNRLEAMGPSGCARLLVRKICTNFGDGTLAWRKEGDFFMEVAGTSDVVKWWYGVDPNYTTVPPYSFVAQPLWLLVLLGCVACMLRRRPTRTEAVAALCVGMLAVFLAVFECRARYLFLYAPAFCLLASVGWREVGRLVLGQSREWHSHPFDRRSGGMNA